MGTVTWGQGGHTRGTEARLTREKQKDMVTGDGHGHREFRGRSFGHRELAPGIRRLKAERLAPERLTTVAVTRHLE